MKISENSYDHHLLPSFVQPVGGKGMGVKGMDGRIVIIASYKFHFIRAHDNLVLDTSKKISTLATSGSPEGNKLLFEANFNDVLF